MGRGREDAHPSRQRSAELTNTEPTIHLSESVWLAAAQGLSSLSNFGINIVALIVLEPVEFGAFSVAILGYRLSVAVTRSLVIEPVLTHQDVESLLRGSPAVAFGWGMAVFLPALVIVAVAGNPLRGVVLALIALGPALLAEEAFRQLLVARGQLKRACAIEGIWVLVAAIAVGVLLLTDSFGPVSGFVAWGGAGAVAAAAGVLLSGDRAHRGEVIECSRAVRATFGLLAATTAATRGATQVAVVLVGVVLGLDGLGRLRGAQTLVSPAAVLVQAARLSSFKSSAGIEGQIRRTRQVHSIAFIGAVVWSSIVVFALPFLDRWFDATRVSAGAVPFEGLTIALVILAASAELTFRFKGAYEQLLRRSLVWMPIPIILAPTGAVLFGPAGAAAGTALALAFRVILLRWPTSAKSND